MGGVLADGESVMTFFGAEVAAAGRKTGIVSPMLGDRRPAVADGRDRPGCPAAVAGQHRGEAKSTVLVGVSTRMNRASPGVVSALARQRRCRRPC